MEAKAKWATARATKPKRSADKRAKRASKNTKSSKPAKGLAKESVKTAGQGAARKTSPAGAKSRQPGGAKNKAGQRKAGQRRRLTKAR